jgi:hypothetical protein
MYERALLVRDIVANLLLTNPGMITDDSDFFLLGGNPLLLGKLSYFIRKAAGANFTNSTIKGIASLIEVEDGQIPQKGLATSIDMQTYREDDGNDLYSTLGHDYDLEDPMESSRGQTHPLSLIVQAIPIVFLYPLKAAYTCRRIFDHICVILLIFPFQGLSCYSSSRSWRLTSTTVFGSALLLFAQSPPPRSLLVLFRLSELFSSNGSLLATTKPGSTACESKHSAHCRHAQFLFCRWSMYHLRWWIVNQVLRSAGRGIFSIHPCLEILYYRMLGARIGKHVWIDPEAHFGEFDLLTLRDGCCIDTSHVRGFCVERKAIFVWIRLSSVAGHSSTHSPNSHLALYAVLMPLRMMSLRTSHLQLTTAQCFDNLTGHFKPSWRGQLS